jgi:radical SAM superfamily enzyme YgiQ (UPF0313 family)
MKLFFIWPNIGTMMTGDRFDDKARMEPLGFAVLAGLTPKHHQISFFDDRIDRIPFDGNPDLVLISIEIFTARRGYQIADEFRKNHVKVILGGIHTCLMPEEASQYADSIFIGDAEQGWREVLKDLENNQLKEKYQFTPGIAHPGIFPDKSIFKNKKYLPFSLTQFSRGCPHSCSYCAVTAYFERKIYIRKIEDVVNEITFYKKKLWFFVDDNIISNPHEARQLFKALIPLKIKWVGQCSIDLAEDDELLNLCAKSGCIGLVIGFETISNESLKDLNKGPNIDIAGKYPVLIKKIHQAGVHIWAAFTVGHDFETRQSIADTLHFALKHNFAFAAFNILMPYPKTPLYDKLTLENRHLFDGKWWLAEDYHFNQAAFVPKNLEPDELTRLCREMKVKWSSPVSIFRRFLANLNFKTIGHGWFLLRMLVLFKTEALKKNFLMLGYFNSKPKP